MLWKKFHLLKDCAFFLGWNMFLLSVKYLIVQTPFLTVLFQDVNHTMITLIL